MDYKENKKGITNTQDDQKGDSINLEEKREESPIKKMVAVLQKKALDFTERPEWLNKLINLSEEIYYLTYLDKKNKTGKKIFTENYFRNEWPNSLYALAGKKIPVELLIQLCENGTITDPSRPFNEEELEGKIGKIQIGEESLKDLCKKQKEEVIMTLDGIKNSISHNKDEKLYLENTRIGKMIYQDYFRIAGKVNIILNHLAYAATRIKGYDAFASFNKKEESFFIQSKDLVALKRLFEELNEKFPGCADIVENAMIHGKIVDGLTEEIFLNTIDPKILIDSKKIFKTKKQNENSEPKKEDIIKIEQKDTKQNSETKTGGQKKPEENSEKMISVLEAEKKLDEARGNYINEYNKCKNEADKVSLIQKTKNKILNIFKTVPENKIKVKPEDFFTQKTIEAKKAYTKAKKEMGNAMFNQKKSELEKAGLSRDELTKALEEYKAIEILEETIINERQKIIDARVTEKPILFKRLLDGWLKIKPKWKRVALSTIVFLPLAGFGAVGAAAFSYGALGVAGLATVKFAASMGIGAVVGQSARGIDWIKKGSDVKFAQNQQDKKTELKEKFSRSEIELEEYEKEIDILEKAEKSRNRNRAIAKGVVGGIIAFGAGFAAYDAMGNGISHIDNVHGSLESVQNTPLGTETINSPSVIKHLEVEATADHGQGAISTLRELQKNLNIEYGDNLDNAPVSVKHILETDPPKLAEELGMYKPGEDAESLLIKSGSSFKVDSSGTLNYHDVDTNSDVTLIKGTELKAHSSYEGRMVDTDHSGVQTEINRSGNENIIDNPNFNEGVKTPQVAPEIIDLNSTNENTIGAPNIKEIDSSQVEPKVIDLNKTDLKTNANEVSANLLSTEELNESKVNYLRNLFPTEKLMRNWSYINRNVSAERLIELSNNEQISAAYEPLSHHIKNLQDLSGLNPYQATNSQPAESISHFMNRAYGEINELGKIEDIKMFDNSNLEAGSANIKMTNLEDILKSTPNVHEVNIDRLKDLKEITKGYEDIPPGQLPLKMIMENVSEKGLHSLVSEDIAETKTAAIMASNFKMNSIMSSIKGTSHGDYYFNKILPNGNVKLIHIKFYK